MAEPKAMTPFHLRTTCRLCGGVLVPAFELTPTPPANELVSYEFLYGGDLKVESGEKQDEFPLPLASCSVCGHVQLTCVVDPARLFANYPYRSGASPVFRKHLEKYARGLVERFGTPKFLLEIGSNDGTFLNFFVGPNDKPFGGRVLGVEPDPRCCDASAFEGLAVVQGFFSEKMARRFRTKFGNADLIVANHVLAHADDLVDIVKGVHTLLSDDGVFVFEVGYLGDVVEKCLWDVIYHEHLSYHHLRPLIRFLDPLGLNVFDAERVDTQGGSLRVYCRKNLHEGNHLSKRAEEIVIWEKENGLRNPDNVRPTLLRMSEHIEESCDWIRNTLGEMKLHQARIAGYGAPAKCVTMLHHLGIGRETIDYIVDDNPVKLGKFIPGKGIEIRPVDALYRTDMRPDVVLLLGWNFAEDIIKRHPGFRWVVPAGPMKGVVEA